MPWQKLLIAAIFVAILYNLGAALYYMYFDQPGSSRMARALTWRIGLSVGLIVAVILGIFSGLIEPHGLRVGH